MKALIVEDDSRIASAMAQWLTDAGCEVAVTHSLEEAESFIRNDSVNVITLDLNLSDSNHGQTVERIERIRTYRPNAVLIVVSGIATINDEKDLQRRGADALIEKMEVPTERSFFGRLSDIANALMGKKHDFSRNTEALARFARMAARRCNELGCGIAERLSGKH